MNFKIYYPTPLEYCDINNDNIDICLELEDGRKYTLVVITPDNLNFIMEKEGNDYIEPTHPFLIVKRLEEKIINQIISELISDGDAFLRAYGSDVE